MASPNITVAEASLKASLLGPKPHPVPRHEISRLFSHLHEAVKICSPTNVQRCKDWLLDHIVPSPARTNTFGKYLVAIALSYEKGPEKNKGSTETDGGVGDPPMRRKRLHLLYMLHDVLHHAKYHGASKQRFSEFVGEAEPYLVSLLGIAASSDEKRREKNFSRLQDLVALWKQHDFFSPDSVRKLTEALENDLKAPDGQHKSASVDSSGLFTPEVLGKQGKEPPYILPALHGDASTPWHDLPAGNWIPHIIPNSTAPMNPHQLKPLQLAPGPADPALVSAVQNFLKDVSNITDDAVRNQTEDDEDIKDMDELGQPLISDPTTGDLIPKESYYGWSIAFCEQMRRHRKEGLLISSDPHDLTRSRSHTPLSSSRTSSPRKRRRFSSQTPSTRSRSRSRSRSPYSPLQHSEPPPRHIPRQDQNPPSYLPHQPFNFQPPFPPGSSAAPNAPLITPSSQIDAPFPATIPPRPAPQTTYQHHFPADAQGNPRPPAPSWHDGPWPPNFDWNAPPPPPPPPAHGMPPGIPSGRGGWMGAGNSAPPGRGRGRGAPAQGWGEYGAGGAGWHGGYSGGGPPQPPPPPPSDMHATSAGWQGGGGGVGAGGYRGASNQWVRGQR